MNVIARAIKSNCFAPPSTLAAMKIRKSAEGSFKRTQNFLNPGDESFVLRFLRLRVYNCTSAQPRTESTIVILRTVQKISIIVAWAGLLRYIFHHWVFSVAYFKIARAKNAYSCEWICATYIFTLQILYPFADRFDRFANDVADYFNRDMCHRW